MRRSAGAMLLLVAVGGCMTSQSSSGPDMCSCAGCNGRAAAPMSVPGVQAPWGQSVPMAQPYASATPGNQAAALAMMSQSIPMDQVQLTGATMAGASSELMQAQFCPPGGCPPGGCPPGTMAPQGGLLSPFGVPGMPGGPGAPMIPMMGGAPPLPPGMPPPSMAVAAAGALAGGNGVRFPTQRTQVRFARPSGMVVSWYTRGADGKESYSENPIDVPGRYNFLQGAIYRLKLANIPGRPNLFVYPTLEVVPCRPETEEFLSHCPVPLDFSDEDFRQITAGNYVVKVIYLPRRENQDLATTGPDAIVSTQLEPGADPIQEALRRGSILLVVRMGSIDQEPMNSPQLGAAAAGAMPGMAMMPPQGMPGMAMGPGGMGGMMPPPGMAMGPGGMGGMMPPPGMAMGPGGMGGMGGMMPPPGMTMGPGGMGAMVPPQGAPGMAMSPPPAGPGSSMPPSFQAGPGATPSMPALGQPRMPNFGGAMPPPPVPSALAVPSVGPAPGMPTRLSTTPPGPLPPQMSNTGVPVTYLPEPSELQRLSAAMPPSPSR